MFAWAQHGAREGSWIVAERQIAGRGRLGRPWLALPGNLYASSLVQLKDGDPPASTLALVAGCAVHQAIQALGLAIGNMRLKWPNDVLIDRAKVAGILLERRDRVVVVGVGINLVASPTALDRLTTNLGEHRDRVVTPKEVMPLLSNWFWEFLLRWRTERYGGFDWLRKSWLRVAHPVGTPLQISLPDGDTISGEFDGLTPDCALQLRLPDGTIRVIHAGDVFLI